LAAGHYADDLPTPVVTVVVPTFNRAHLLVVCLRSLLAQDLAEHYEVLVIDDGSTDDTRSVVEAMRSKAADEVDLRYEWQLNAGINAGRNHGLTAAGASLVCFVDDDVEAPPGWLGALVRGARAHPQADVLGGPIALRFEGRLPRTCGREQLPETSLDRGPQMVWNKMLYGANFAVRKTAVDRLGGFDDSRGSGWVWGDEEEFERRLLAAGGHTLYLPDAAVWHRRTQDDLRVRSLLRKEFVRGMTQRDYGRRGTGHRGTVTAELELLTRGLYHTVRRRCVLGLLICARATGHLAAMWTKRAPLRIRRCGVRGPGD